MSTTTTQVSTLDILADYDLHHSGSEATSNVEPIANPRAPTPQSIHWPCHYRRMPPHRPTNRNLDQAERPAGVDLPEFLFIQSMLHGVWLNASVSRLWRFTGGRMNDRIFRYDVGGEW
ncbi:hypothetical protein P175DRAFT_0445380 [Aspergillus ochraceoroseus IBT 24754]|uniref:Uncharacterized protein n=1 Tax=Aspergillus ochraceoroseus IBT 24754 TaxID=1392256 RepID=A0A2T5LNP4_9EURO|nr:uncharacterized protein P175DRAFT_0445380 [Aspergillus ochraceoroseus IBT 24754]PTU17904.1 hypothetical protein P175DRAFT_0445380 [Aspergillus ochraceoroseus IBT 24754]